MFRLVRSASASTAISRVKFKLYGLVMLAIVSLFIGLTSAIYNDAFEDVVPVTLQVQRAGLQLNDNADVKIRGVIVGNVRDISVQDRVVALDLALDPDKVSQVPADVKARLVPKTLFGEKYVSLTPPGDGAQRHVRAGDVIEQDRSEVALELQRLWDDLLPMLRAIEPAKLNATLNAIASALEGRGDEIGQNLVRLRNYLSELNPELPTLKRDITLLADFARTYSQAAPDLVRMLRNFTVTSNTVIDKRQSLDAFLNEVTLFAETGREVLAANEERIIRFNEVSSPTLDMLARYSPEYPCLLGGLARLDDRFSAAFGGNQPGLHITLEVVQPRPPYEYPEDKPENGSIQQRERNIEGMVGYNVERGPNCYGLPDNPPEHFTTTEAAKDRGGGGSGQSQSQSQSQSQGRALSGALTDASMGYAGTAAEQRVVNHIVGPVMSRPPGEVPDIATLLFGPMARGTAVNVQ